MITVSILINGEPIFTRSAVNTGKTNGLGQTVYDVDTGTRVCHDRDAGAVVLAKLLLDTVQEPGVDRRAPKRRRRRTKAGAGR